VFGCVESCRTYFLCGNRQTKKLELKLENGRCQHLYFYHLPRDFGLMHLRLQSWFPFQVQVCLNGRHWLARQMDRHHLDYTQKENGFTWIGQIKGAQRLLDQQLEMNWPDQLDQILRQNHPLAQEIGQPLSLRYYWTTQESQYATDVMFKRPAPLQRLYPALVRHAITRFSSTDVMRFLGRRVPAHGTVDPRFEGQVVSDLKARPEGLRVKHSVDANSIKMYDKQGSVLRVETTINNPKDFRVFRAAQSGPHGRAKNVGKKSWRTRRRSVVDLQRRAEVSRASNERYLTALAATAGKVPLFQWVQSVGKPVEHNGRRVRALNPWSPKDADLLRAVNRGEFKINGFRNRDLRALLFTTKTTAELEKRRAGVVTRKIALLKAHGLIKKIQGTHRYVLTNKGATTITALLAALQADVSQLTQLAA
jgi:hypothetical protein